MRVVILAFFMSVGITGCATKGVNATLFLKEKDQFLTNLQGANCVQSGQQVMKAPDGETYRMIHIYSNCDVHLNRKMEDFEPQQWGIKKKGSLELSK